ncbi:MAG: 16S rRNA (guanine(966)-N(2))-methyltransferase RsmD [Campylobacterales bacterium]|nr:16S rRNA (guanine(966)-N(2))-methyltransferase RsmD [Campylobacterales bacterium]
MKKNATHKTKIIAGIYKGIMLDIPNIDTTRASKAILKESIFNTLQFKIIDKLFFEVFGGSGSVGLEALSRGASKVFFIEKNPQTYKILQSNIDKLNPLQCNAYLGDSFKLFERVYSELKSLNKKSYIYLDPPFSIREGMDDIYDKTMELIESIEPDVCDMIMVEHMSSLKIPKSIGEYKLLRSKKFGRTTISYYEPKENI